MIIVNVGLCNFVFGWVVDFVVCFICFVALCSLLTIKVFLFVSLVSGGFWFVMIDFFGFWFLILIVCWFWYRFVFTLLLN